MLQRPEVCYLVGRHLAADHRAPFAGILAHDQQLIAQEIIGVVHQRHIERSSIQFAYVLRFEGHHHVHGIAVVGFLYRKILRFRFGRGHRRLRRCGSGWLRLFRLVALVGESFQEMRFLHIKLVITFDKVVADNEMWYISEWLKENRINDRRVKDSSVRELSHFLGTEIYEYAEATGSGNVKLKDFLKRAKGFSIK